MAKNNPHSMIDELNKATHEYNKIMESTLAELKASLKNIPEEQRNYLEAQINSMQASAKNLDIKALQKLQQNLANFAKDANRTEP